MAATKIHDGTGDGIREFLDLAPDKRWMNETTAKACKATVTQVLSVVAGAGYAGDIDLRNLDDEAAFAKFKAERGDDYTKGSLATYQTRFRKAVDLYRRFLKDPDSLPTAPEGRREFRATTGVEADPPLTAVEWHREQDHQMIEYPFPLSDGGTAYLRLPRNLLAPDVDRLIAFLKSIAIKPRGQGMLPLNLPQPE